MIPESDWYGGATLLSISADTTVYPSRFRLYTISATTTGLKAVLDDARRYAPGMPRCAVAQKFGIDITGSNSVILTNSAGTTLATLAAGSFTVLSLLDYSTQAGVWSLKTGTTGSAVNPAPTELMYYVGGSGGSGNYNRTHEYNQSTDTWTAKTNAGYDQFSSSCTAFGGAMYFFGAATGDSRRVQKYDPDTWTAGTSMPGSTTDGGDNDSASTIAGKGYAFGGDNVETRTAEYDGATWVVKTARTSGRQWTISSSPFPALDIANTIAYLLAGGNSTNHNYCDSYVVDTYTAITERPGPVFFDEGRCRNDSAGEVYVLGGNAGFSNGDTVSSNRVTKFVAASNAHVAVSAFPLQCRGLMGAQYGTTAYMAMPNSDPGGGTSTAALYSFDMPAQTYLTKTSPPARKENHPQNASCAVPP